MKIETPKERRERKLRQSMALSAARERLEEAEKAARAQEDGFLRMCWQNHQEALEREQAEAGRVIVVPTTAPKPPAVDQVSRIKQKSISFLNGLSLGALAALLIVWLLLLAAGVV